LTAAGQQLAQAINHLNERIQSLEGAPAKQRMEQEWQAITWRASITARGR
jgi:hypothetical protein